MSSEFHRFIALHAFLSGLFPFFIPVFLWRRGHDLGELSAFIAATGAGFLLALYLWDRLRRRLPFGRLIAMSFALEGLLLLGMTSPSHPLFLLWLGLLNGFYNCFFWITQRVLFLDTLQARETGRRVGNFQILAMVALKAGMLAGGAILDGAGFVWILSASLLLDLVAALHFERRSPTPPAAFTEAPPLSLARIFKFDDAHGSRFVFLLDGPFLFLESYFWTLSLFLLVKESFWKLGLLVIALGLLFSLLFWWLKNRIDHLPQGRIYRLAVAGYLLAWAARAGLDAELGDRLLFSLLIFITFATAFFRLAFNRRFFELARAGDAHDYLLTKSYLSQASLALGFLAAAGLLQGLPTDTALTITYLAAALFTPLYLGYAPRSLHAGPATSNQPLQDP